MSPALQSFAFDTEKLLSPISAESPAGEALRYDKVYDRIKEARRQDDAGLAQGVWKADLKRADWSEAEALCLETLETRSKDLQIAGWLLEAWLHLHGLRGAAEGMKLILALCDGFWDELHPQIRDGDAEYRMAPIHWINEKLERDLKLLPLTRPEPEGDVYTLSDWENAMRLEGVEARAAQGSPDTRRKTSQARFHESVALTPSSYFHGLLRDSADLLQHCAAVESFLDQHLGKSAAGLAQFRSTTESIYHLVNTVLKQREPEAPPEDAGAPPAPEAEAEWPEEPAAQASAARGRIRTREEAYRMLAEAADFLMRTEPHSPTPYLVRRAISWGGMRLDELLPELVRNNNELTEIFRLLQIGAPERSGPGAR